MALVSNYNLASSVQSWIAALRKRDFFRVFLIYVFMRHVPRQVEAPEHYLTGRRLTQRESPQSWFLKIVVQAFNYFVEEPVRTVAIAVEASVRKDFDASVIKEKEEKGLLLERNRLCDEELKRLQPVIDLMKQMTEIASQEIGDSFDLNEMKQTLEKVTQAACATLTNSDLIESLETSAQRLEMAKADLQETERLLREAHEKFQVKLMRLNGLMDRCKELDLDVSSCQQK